MLSTSRTSRRARIALVSVALAGSLGLAACGSDDSSGSAAGTTAAPAMSSSSMSPTTMSPTTMASGAASGGAMMGSKPFGPACSGVPASGAGSFAGMAMDPAATAASNNPVLSTLVTAVKAAGLADTLNGPGPFTIFAPSNDAFAKVDKATLDSLLADPKGKLTKVLTYHVVAGKKLDADQLAAAGSETTIQGGAVKVARTGDSLTVNGAKVVCGNISTANATVFIVDSVLLPS